MYIYVYIINKQIHKYPYTKYAYIYVYTINKQIYKYLYLYAIYMPIYVYIVNKQIECTSIISNTEPRRSLGAIVIKKGNNVTYPILGMWDILRCSGETYLCLLLAWPVDIYVFIYIYTYIYIYKYPYTYIYVYIYKYIYIYIHVYTCVHMYVYTYIYIYLCEIFLGALERRIFVYF
jgi:hypothetical protein